MHYLKSILLTAVLCQGLAGAELAGSQPNIIFVLTDDQGMGDLSCMGNPYLKTPHIDRFYEQSTRFADFQVSPTCAPTRAALMSGRFPFRVGVTHTIKQRERMALEVYTLPEMLQSAGYQTGIFGKWHLGDGAEYLPQARGFDEVLIHGAGGIGQVGLGDFEANGQNKYFDNVLYHNDKVVKTEGFCTDTFFDAAERWIKKQEDAGDPYFAFIPLNAPHGPMIAPAQSKKRFLEMGMDGRSAARYGMIENIDDNFGEMMGKLKSWGALENTIVIFMTDNGMSMGKIRIKGESITPFNAGLKAGKNRPWEGGTHVPSFWYWDQLGHGVDIKALTAHIDLYQTFAELAGATLPEKMQELDGRSLLPLLKDPQAEWEDRKLFIHCGRWDAGKRDSEKYKNCAVRSQRWRLVNNEELYDIANDPSETTNVIEQHPEVVKELRAAYEEWWNGSVDLMINEGLDSVKEHPLHQVYTAQEKSEGIPFYDVKGE